MNEKTSDEKVHEVLLQDLGLSEISESTTCPMFRNALLHRHKISTKMKDYFMGLKSTSHLLSPPAICTNIKAFQSQLTWNKKDKFRVIRNDFRGCNNLSCTIHWVMVSFTHTHTHTLSWNCAYHLRMELSDGGSFPNLVRNCRWTIVTDRHSWNVSTQNAFSLPYAAILVNCAPSGEMHNYCTPHIIKENLQNFSIHRCNYILLSQVCCVW